MRPSQRLMMLAAGLIVLAAGLFYRFGPRILPHTGPVSLHVPGAMNLAVYCGGTETHFAEGEWIEFLPEGKECDLEGPMSPVMPVRGHFVLDGSARYACTRRAAEYICTGEG